MVSDPEWDAFVEQHGHFLQTGVWGAFKSQFGWVVERVGIFRQGRLVAGAQVLFRPLPLGFSIAYVPRGPVLAHPDPDLLVELVRDMDGVARRHRAIFLKVEPHWEDAPEARTILRAAGFQPSPHSVQPRSTLLVDLTPAPDEILARMKSKWRYNIRLARRKGVIVRPVQNEVEVDHFLALMKETARRDGFPIHTDEYYRRAWQMFGQGDTGVLLMAWYKDLPLAGIFVVRGGTMAIYMYGASGARERHRMPNHLLQWEGMMWARERGAREYDLWGIPDEVGARPEEWAKRTPERTDGLWGVFRFKQGFGGRIVRMVGAWDRVYHRGLYYVFRQFMQWRSR